MLIGPRALKTLNIFEKIQPRMMAATFNGNPRATIIYYSPTNVNEETELVAFNDELSSLVRSITKHVFVIGGDMNAQIGKNGNKYSLHNTSNRNGQHLTDFGRCPWGNGYRRRIWTRRHEFKSWTRGGVVWFYGISTFVGYLTPNPFLC